MIVWLRAERIELVAEMVRSPRLLAMGVDTEDVVDETEVLLVKFLRVLLIMPLSSENFLRTSSTLELSLISLGSILCIIVNNELGLGAISVLLE